MLSRAEAGVESVEPWLLTGEASLLALMVGIGSTGPSSESSSVMGGGGGGRGKVRASVGVSSSGTGGGGGGRVCTARGGGLIGREGLGTAAGEGTGGRVLADRGGALGHDVVVVVVVEAGQAIALSFCRTINVL